MQAGPWGCPGGEVPASRGRRAGERSPHPSFPLPHALPPSGASAQVRLDRCEASGTLPGSAESTRLRGRRWGALCRSRMACPPRRPLAAPVSYERITSAVFFFGTLLGAGHRPPPPPPGKGRGPRWRSWQVPRAAPGSSGGVSPRETYRWVGKPGWFITVSPSSHPIAFHVPRVSRRLRNVSGHLDAMW